MVSRFFSKIAFVYVVMMTYSQHGLCQASVVNNITAFQAVQYLVGEDVVFSNATFTGDGLQLGLLSGLGYPSPFLINQGVVLCTDDAMTLVPSQTVSAIATNNNQNIDLLSIAQLVPSLIGQSFSISSVNNVAQLEFDFVASGSEINFNFIFGSDEYLTYVNTQYNDVFAFFLSGPGITGPYSAPQGFEGGAINLAQIPGSLPPLPITVSSVNNVLNSQYYIDNAINENIGANGYTLPIVATHELVPG